MSLLGQVYHQWRLDVLRLVKRNHPSLAEPCDQTVNFSWRDATSFFYKTLLFCVVLMNDTACDLTVQDLLTETAWLIFLCRQRHFYRMNALYFLLVIILCKSYDP